MPSVLTMLVWERASVGGSPLLAMLHLATFAAPNGYIGNVNMPMMATRCRISEDRAYKILQELVEKGLLSKSRDHNQCAAYRIVLESLR
jgi:Helix-turn-helix domain